jgi:hypothetical protein
LGLNYAWDLPDKQKIFWRKTLIMGGAIRDVAHSHFAAAGVVIASVHVRLADF